MTSMTPRSWKSLLRGTLRGFAKDKLTDWAAALTYYAVLSIFPAIVVVTSLTALLGPSATASLVDNIQAIVPGQAAEILTTAVEELKGSASVAGPLAVLGLLGALWTSSGYIGAFMRASNAIYEMPEGRPLWKTIPLRIGMTVTVAVLLALCAAGVVATGAIAERIGSAIGIGTTGLTIWGVVKWPVIAVLVSLVIALLYWAAPNVRHPGFRWITPGGVLAVLIWAAASAGFAVYVANFGSYNKTYGSLGGIIAFLVWLWITNLAVLLGAELDAEIARTGASAEDDEPFLPPRDTRALDDQEREDLGETTRT
ncbi:ribonuclease [Actinokineospora fastidiosa]|uniref:Ribonuclease n=2 Tax=Actinokineospora fastidiosa TaxID=1816 RepID=A0A918GDX5_9PSEU|nr:ribonuclease [Actinokineospora fastidiosa]